MFVSLHSPTRLVHAQYTLDSIADLTNLRQNSKNGLTQGRKVYVRVIAARNWEPRRLTKCNPRLWECLESLRLATLAPKPIRSDTISQWFLRVVLNSDYQEMFYWWCVFFFRSGSHPWAPNTIHAVSTCRYIPMYSVIMSASVLISTQEKKTFRYPGTVCMEVLRIERVLA
jgi:hypothetical protein